MNPKEAHRRGFHLHTRAIPVTRLAGLALIAVLIPLHNAAVFGYADWRAANLFAGLTTVYCLASWAILRMFYSRTKTLHLGVVFLAADIFPLILAIALTGGPQSWLFFLLAGRCVDQITHGFRRTVWSNHLVVGSYALLLASISARHGGVHWRVEAAKLCVLYSFNWYCSLTARTVTTIRAGAKRAESAKRAKAEFVGTVSHEIRTRLNGVLILIELLQKTELTSRQQSYSQTSAECIQKLADLAALLDSSEMEPSQLAIHPVVFSPRDLVKEVESLMRPAAESKGLDFRVEMAEEASSWVIGDHAKILRALLSLSHNAVRFTEVGFVELKVWRPEPGRIAFQVADSGIGITMYVRRRLFGNFVRADGSQWRSYRGKQIGLPVAKRLVELMGGALELESRPGVGTAIRFVLDLTDCAASITGGAASEPPGEGDSQIAEPVDQ